MLFVEATSKRRFWPNLDASKSGALRFALTMVVVDYVLVRFFDGSPATYFASFSVVAVLWFMDFEGTAVDRLKAFTLGTIAGLVGTAAGCIGSTNSVLATAIAFVFVTAYSFTRVLPGGFAQGAIGPQLGLLLALLTPNSNQHVGTATLGWLAGSAISIAIAMTMFPRQSTDDLRQVLSQWCMVAKRIAADPTHVADVDKSRLNELDDAAQKLSPGSRAIAISPHVRATMDLQLFTTYATSSLIKQPPPEFATEHAQIVSDLGQQATELEAATSIHGPAYPWIRPRRKFRTLRSNLSWHSPAVRDSLRIGFAVAVAVAVARLTGVEHGFWVSAVVLCISSAHITLHGTSKAALQMAVGSALGLGLAAVAVVFVPGLWVLPLLGLAAFVSKLESTRNAFLVQMTYTPFCVLNVAVLSWPNVTVSHDFRLEDVALGALVAVIATFIAAPKSTTKALDVLWSHVTLSAHRVLSSLVHSQVLDSKSEVTSAPGDTSDWQDFESAKERYVDSYHFLKPALPQDQAAAQRARAAWAQQIGLSRVSNHPRAWHHELESTEPV